MIKNIVVAVDNVYLQQVAAQRGISRTRLVQLLMEKIIRERLAADIVTAADVAADVPAPRYRRFHPRTGAKKTAT